MKPPSRSHRSINGIPAPPVPGIPVVAVGLALVAGCATSLPVPDLGGIYNRSARYHDAYRNPVIVIPGVLGTRLKDPESGTIVWGAFGGDYANPHDPVGARLAALPMQEGVPLRELRDPVVPDGVLDRVKIRVLGVPLELRAYFQILGALGAGGYRDQELGMAGAIDYGDDHFTCFQFGYDWRRDNVESVQELHRFILRTREYVRQEIRKRHGVDRPDIKFDIIAHSMGGLLTRYYLRYGDADLPEDGSLPEVTWEGAKYIDRAILVGTPNAGSAQAIVQLVEGIRFAPIFHKHEASLLGTFPSIYQLFPRPRHGALLEAGGGEKLDGFDPELWKNLGWGLASPEEDWVLQMLLPEVEDREERRRIALDHQGKCLLRARQLAAALDRPAPPPPGGVELYLMAGDAVPTGSVLAVDRERRSVEWIESSPGDGTVTRASALLDERVGGEWTHSLVSPIRWRQVFFLFMDHLGLTRDPAFTDNVLYLLLEDPRSSQ